MQEKRQLSSGCPVLHQCEGGHHRGNSERRVVPVVKPTQWLHQHSPSGLSISRILCSRGEAVHRTQFEENKVVCLCQFERMIGARTVLCCSAGVHVATGIHCCGLCLNPAELSVVDKQ